MAGTSNVMTTYVTTTQPFIETNFEGNKIKSKITYEK